MLRINLLPPYIYEGKRKKQLIGLWSVIGAATVGGFLFLLSGLNATLEKDKADEQAAKDEQAKYQALETKIGAVKREIAEVKEKQTFIASSQVYNDSWREGFLLVRDVVNPRIVLQAINFDQSRSSVQMNAFAPSEMDAIKWWMVLLNQNDKFTNVNITLPPHGYQPGGGVAAVGAPGAPGGSSGGGPVAATMNSTTMGGGPTMMGRGGPMGGGSMGGMGGGAAANAGGPAVLEGRNGFEFVCTAGLVNPLKGGAIAPSWAGVGSGAATGVPGGGMGGSMGMMGGGMSGGSMGMAPAPGKGGGTAD